MWQKTRDTLLVVEPGTPAGYARIIALREHLIAAGAHVAAPCPHDGHCPLAAPDWCHFTQRLQRSRAHKQVKGAELPFEDEKFCLCRADARAGRAAPLPGAGAACCRQGRGDRQTLHARTASKSQGSPAATRRIMRIARRWRWGDAVDHSGWSAWAVRADPGSTLGYGPSHPEWRHGTLTELIPPCFRLSHAPTRGGLPRAIVSF